MQETDRFKMDENSKLRLKWKRSFRMPVSGLCGEIEDMVSKPLTGIIKVYTVSY